MSFLKSAQIGPWTTGEAYAVGAQVNYSKQQYVCLTANTAGSTFAADFALGYWRIINEPNVGRNYVQVGNNFESGNVDGWQKFNISGYTAGTTPTTAPTIGTAASIGTLQVSASSAISGTKSLNIGNAASTNFTAGQGVISQVYGVDSAEASKVMSSRFAYLALAGASFMNFSGSSSNTWAMYVYDVTNSAWLQPGGVYNIIQSALVGNCLGTLQIPSNLTQFRIAILCVNTTTASSPSANALQMNFDDFYFGPQVTLQGPSGPVGEIIATGSVTPPPGFLYCNGQSVLRSQYQDLFNYIGTVYGTADSTHFNVPDMRGYFPRGADDGTGHDPNAGSRTAIATGGATGSGPGSFQADQIASHRHVMNYGDGVSGSTADHGYVPNVPTGYSSTGDSNGAQTYLTGGSQTHPKNVNMAYHIRYVATHQQSADTDSRIVALSAKTAGTPTFSPALSNTVTSTVIFGTVDKDTHASYNASTGVWICPSSGFYDIDAAVFLGGTYSSHGDSVIYVTVNGSAVRSNRVTNSSAAGTIVSTPISINNYYLNANDTVQIQVVPANWTSVSAQSDGTAHYFDVHKVSGPSVVLASEKVYARYTTTTAASNNSNRCNFETKDFDSHGAVTTGAGAWQFKAPRAGVYQVSAYMNGGANVGNFGQNTMPLYKNGSAHQNLTMGAIPGVSCNVLQGCGLIKLNAGDLLYVSNNGGSVTVTDGWIAINSID